MQPERTPLDRELPPAARPAVEIVRRLRAAGHAALLAGGCVRDLLLDRAPQDYDVATDAPPPRVCALFRTTREVGAQFGVVLVRQGRRWIEVATFRTDGTYRDGRHPESVQYGDAAGDARRRDFTINGMFLDPIDRQVIDYVGGRRDLRARLVRAIGDPAQRFAEDHLRLLRAVRFAARLSFEIEPRTLAAIQTLAPRLADVAAERRRDESEKMLGHPHRAAAFALLRTTGLLDHLWPAPRWSADELIDAEATLRLLPENAPFEVALAAILQRRDADEITRVCRALACSNAQRETVLWLRTHLGSLDDPAAPTLAQLKRLMASPAFAGLCMLAEARWRQRGEESHRRRQLAQRLADIAPDQVQPAPFVRGDDLARRSVPSGPQYKRILDTLYERQLNEEFADRDAALEALDTLLGQQKG